MADLVSRYKRGEVIRSTALSLIAGLRPKDWAGEVKAIFDYVRDHIRYTRDVRGVETLQTPMATLELEAGDCDDKSTLLAALLESVGHPTRFVAVGFSHPGSFSHVYVESKIGDRWMALDATMSTATVGWAPPRPAMARMVIHN